MENLLAEYDYYTDKVHPQCIATFQSRVKHMYKEEKVTVVCQIRPHTVNKKTKLQLWLLQTDQQDWLKNDELKDKILGRLVDNFRFCVETY